MGLRYDVEICSSLSYTHITMQTFVETTKGMQPLHIAVRYGNIEGIALLLKQGATLTAKTARGETPLHIAAIYGRKECIPILIDNGASIFDKGG